LKIKENVWNYNEVILSLAQNAGEPRDAILKGFFFITCFTNWYMFRWHNYLTKSLQTASIFEKKIHVNKTLKRFLKKREKKWLTKLYTCTCKYMLSRKDKPKVVMHDENM
jgi:hypothetical protein